MSHASGLPASRPRTLTFVTGNAGKVTELAHMLAPLGIGVVQDHRGYPELQADSLEEVCAFGARHLLAEGLRPPFVIEDSGLFVDALQGFPGVFSRHALDSIGLAGLLRLLPTGAPRTAHFASCIWLQDGPGEAQARAFAGRCDGRLADAARGSGGFGFDPVFVPDGQPAGQASTFAEMGLEGKARLSHRGQAVRLLVEHLSETAKR